MAEVVNLRRVRKARVRSERDARAIENRAKFGRSKAERKNKADETRRADRLIDGHRRRPVDPGSVDR